ncbi:HAD family phosphatase [Phocaeicola abscessus]|uniref:HAD family hydrolase n=1 Tax=Phocaeicola abscessus TaxID=555313 RepID=UPI0004B5177B|nr:HAD hydrolase-like protein [Phocaeicola abscessus]
MYRDAFKNYLQTHGYASFDLKAVLFDMDGVLFDSMPAHAESWHTVMKRHGLRLDREEAYLHEGRTGAGTIHIVSRRERGRDATPEEIEAIYADKVAEFNKHPQPERMPGAWEVLNQIKTDGLKIILVTGSGQKSLLERLNRSFPHIFLKELMVTAFDVTEGKPSPEPYLTGLKKGRLQPNEGIVVENAPLGVQAASSAGIFTLAVNTGPLPDRVLWDSGANVLFRSMVELSEQWKTFRDELTTNHKVY